MSLVGHKYPVSAARARAQKEPLLIVSENESGSE